MKVPATFAGCCTPDTEETSKAATKAGVQTPEQGGQNSSFVGSNKSYSSNLPVNKSRSAPISFFPLPNRLNLDNKTPDFMILEEREITVEKKQGIVPPELGMKSRESIAVKDTEISKDLGKKSPLDALASFRGIDLEEKEVGRTKYMSQSMKDMRSPVSGFSKSGRQRSCRFSRRRSRSTIRAGSSNGSPKIGRARSCSLNTPRSGLIQKDFFIGDRKFTAKTFVESTISV